MQLNFKLFSLFGEEEMVHWEVNLFKNVFERKFQHLEIAPKLGMGNRLLSLAFFIFRTTVEKSFENSPVQS